MSDIDLATDDLRAPFPYFGGKSRVAEEVWRRFGVVRNYVEPFAGSLAVLLGRPLPFDGVETVNDMNAWLCNFWRALALDSDAVADAADWPVSELDLHARGDAIFFRDDWYQQRGYESVDAWIEWIREDPSHYDPLVAGWWVWGQCCWIGDNWGRRTQTGRGLIARPHLGTAGVGVNRKRPHLGDAGRGVNRQLPHLGTAGVGVNRKLPHLGDAGRGALHQYLAGLSERTRRIRVCCGDWSRVCGETPTVKMGLTAAFLDPPYAVEDRADCYNEQEDRNVAHDVRAWCIERGNDPLMRIALCGYDGEHNELESHGWDVFAWKAHGGYASQSSRGNDNKHRERIWFSPYCLKPNRVKQPELFE